MIGSEFYRQSFMATTALSSLFPVSLNLKLTPSHSSSSSSSQTYLSNSISISPLTSTRSLSLTKLRKSPRGNSPNAKKPNTSSGGEFLDENGVVDDMDGYLNYLSLEYDSVWDTKPSWCQPWTIVLFGTAVIACSWLVLHSSIVTAGIGFLIGTWWYIFLYSYPQEYSSMIAERRKRVTDGVEDTYGSRKSNNVN